jgi:hypothetical protein
MTRDEVITLTLTQEQRRQLETLVRRQGSEHKALLLASVAPFFDLQAGQVRFRLQALMLDWPRANRVLKIIHEGKSKKNKFLSA